MNIVFGASVGSTLEALGIAHDLSVDRLRAVLEAGERALATEPMDESSTPMGGCSIGFKQGWNAHREMVRGGSDVQRQETPR
jgi:hypothetical protein